LTLAIRNSDTQPQIPDHASGEGRALHDNIQRKAFDAGIFGVPTYVIDGEVFFGREHLPRIRWMLTGRSGAWRPRARNALLSRFISSQVFGAAKGLL